MFYVYILKSKTYNRYYIGHSSDWQKRLKEYNAGKVRSTKHYIPWEIVLIEKYTTKSEAFKREQQVKSYRSGVAFKKLINNSESWQSG